MERFRERVLRDEALQKRLQMETSRQEFVLAVVRAGEELGFGFGPREVEEELQRQRRLWWEGRV